MPVSNQVWLKRLLLVFLPALIAGYVYYFTLRPVAVVTPVVAGRAIHGVPGSVEVLAEYTMELKSESSGRIAVSGLEPGKQVFKGDVLVQLDTGDIDLEIERIKNEVTAATKRVKLGSTLQADVQNQEDKVAILERQTKAGSYSESEMEQQRRYLGQLRQRKELDEVSMQLLLDNNENELHTKQRQKEKMTIVAPTDAVIATVNLNARAGDLLGRDMPIATLISSSRTVEAKVSEENFAGIKVGQRAAVSFLGYGSEQYKASVIKVLPTADAEIQRYIVHLKVELPEEKLVPGLTGEVSIVVGEREAAAIIPRRALRGSEVSVVRSGKVEIRKVKVGYTGMNQVEILDGLQKDELIIVEDLDLYRAGNRVRTQILR